MLETDDSSAIERHLTTSLFAYLRRAILAGGGSISAILLRQSASEAWGPETKVPLILVEYQPDTTPRRSDSSVPTFRGERFCMGCFQLVFESVRTKVKVCSGDERKRRQLSPES